MIMMERHDLRMEELSDKGTLIRSLFFYRLERHQVIRGGNVLCSMAALVSVWRCYLRAHFLCVNGFGHENHLQTTCAGGWLAGWLPGH
jgi:hypothetical protein